MISPKCFTPEFLSERGKILQVEDLRNLEKCTLALELVSRLQREGLDFIFKGGTSLLLHCNPARRLSIDVDMPRNNRIVYRLFALSLARSCVACGRVAAKWRTCLVINPLL